jgi:hypothetical protein
MSEHELDQLLNLWEAPAPSRSFREDVRARFPRAEKLGFVRPLRWALATLLTSAALAIALAGAVALAQSNETLADLPVIRSLNEMYQNFLEGRQAARAKNIAIKIAASDPKVYVDGRVAPPLQFGDAATMDVQIPGDGVYSITVFPMGERRTDDRPTGWVEAGHISGNAIEFQVGGKQVRIECDKPVVDRDGPVFATRR